MSQFSETQNTNSCSPPVRRRETSIKIKSAREGRLREAKKAVSNLTLVNIGLKPQGFCNRACCTKDQFIQCYSCPNSFCTEHLLQQGASFKLPNFLDPTPVPLSEIFLTDVSKKLQENEIKFLCQECWDDKIFPFWLPLPIQLWYQDIYSETS